MQCKTSSISAGLTEKSAPPSGLAQGSCLLTGCDDGFVMNNGQCIAQARSGNTYYVDVNGNDSSGNGSQAMPWKTLAHAVGQVPANQDHTIFLKAGTHTETGDIHLPTGIHIQGAGKNATRLMIARLWLESNGGAQGKQVISDLEFSQLKDRGVVVTGRHNVVIHDVRLVGNSDTACLQIVAVDAHGEENPSPPAFFLQGIKVYDSELSNCSQNDISSSRGALEIGHTQGAEIRGLTINEDEGYGIKLKQGGWHKGICVHDNTINVNEEAVGTWGSAIGIELWRMFDNSEIYNNVSNGWFSLVYGNKGNGSYSVRAHHNQIIFYDSSNDNEAFEVAHTLSDVEIDHNYIENTAVGSNVAVAIRGGKPGQNQSNIWVHHNIFKGSTSDGIVIGVGGYSITDVHVYNNIFDDWAAPFLLGGGNEDNRNGSIEDVFVYNNIIMHANQVVATYMYDAILSNIQFKNNILFDSGNDVEPFVGPAPTISFRDNLRTDPQIDSDYKALSASSPVVDAGLDVGLDFLGTAPDIGVFEYSN